MIGIKNTYWYGTERKCRTCSAERQRQYVQRKRGQ